MKLNYSELSLKKATYKILCLKLQKVIASSQDTWFFYELDIGDMMCCLRNFIIMGLR